VLANDVTIVAAEFEQHGGTWNVSVTLRHDDAGWDHYADAWRVVDPDGKELGQRTLFHPHVNEQPFTRSQSGVRAPATGSVVFVEAHDKVHGWSKDRLRVDLQQAQGERFRVRR
jgi:hypothetical protein